MRRHLPYLLLGVIFGFTLIKAEVSSWYRVQEMFHFQSFHMFGIILSAIVTAFIGIQLIRPLLDKPAIDGTPMQIPRKKPGRLRYPVGGFVFGIGWGVIGLCPGPIFALIGSGSMGAFLVLIGTLHGAWLYGWIQHRLPE